MFPVFYGHFLCHFIMGIFPALVIPLTDALKLSVADVLALSFLQFLFFGVTSVAWGALGDRVGGVPLLKVMFAGCSLSTIACAWFLGSSSHLYYALGSVGIFTGIYHPIGMGLISRSAPKLNLAMGYVAAFGGLGMALAPFITGVICWTMGPGYPFIFAAILSATGLILCRGLQDQGEHPTVASKHSPNGIKYMPLITLLVSMVLAGMVATGSTVVFPAFLELGAKDFQSYFLGIFPHLPSNAFFMSIVSVIQLIGVVGQLSGGIIGQKYGPKISYVTCHAVCMFLSFLMSAVSGYQLIMLSSVYFFFLLGNQSMENAILAGTVPKRFQHSIFGLKYILYFGVGSFSVKFMSWVQSTYGIHYSFAGLGIISGLLVISLLLFCLVDRTNIQ